MCGIFWAAKTIPQPAIIHEIVCFSLCVILYVFIVSILENNLQIFWKTTCINFIKCFIYAEQWPFPQQAVKQLCKTASLRNCLQIMTLNWVNSLGISSVCDLLTKWLWPAMVILITLVMFYADNMEQFSGIPMLWKANVPL